MAGVTEMTVYFYLDALCRVHGVMLESVLIFGCRDYYTFAISEVIEPYTDEAASSFAIRVIQSVIDKLKQQKYVAHDIIEHLELFI